MTVRIGDYILYPAFFILIFGIFVSILALLIIKNIISAKKQENIINKNFEITAWQKKYLSTLISEYNKKNDFEKTYGHLVEKLDNYMQNNKYWNVDELIELEDKFVPYITLLLFEVAQEEYFKKNYDNTVLLLNTIDFVNGGMDNPDYFGGTYPWIGDEINESKNHPDMTIEETRTLYLYTSAVQNLAYYIDPDLEKIPVTCDVLNFCKNIRQDEIENALIELFEIIDILSISDKTRDIIAKSLFNSISLLFGQIFYDKDSKDFPEYVDEYRRFSIRALASNIDKQLYSDVVASIDK